MSGLVIITALIASLFMSPSSPAEQAVPQATTQAQAMPVGHADDVAILAPSAYSCDGVDFPIMYVQEVKYGAVQGLHLVEPNAPAFNHFTRCEHLAPVYG